MSWFDTAGLANLAKNLAKEAQKQIDKALDIKDDELHLNNSEIVAKTTTTTTTSSPIQPTIMMSKTAPSSPLDTVKTSSVWGSFTTGSFFENPLTENLTTVTTAPISNLNKNDDELIQSKELIDDGQNRLSALSSESESLEILSNPTTPGSNLTSPSLISAATILGSESVEVLGFETPSEILSPESIIASSSIGSPQTPSSVEIISEDNNNHDHDDLSLEDDSMSYNTVSDTTTAVTVVEPPELQQQPITTAPSRSSLHLSLNSSTNSDKTILNKSNLSEESVCDNTEESTIIDRTIESIEIINDDNFDGDGGGGNINTTSCGSGGNVFTMIEDAMMEKSIETQLSDSTQSFEDVQTNLLLKSYQSDLLQIDTSPPNSDYKSDIVKINSAQTSGHTSGDELETATSSDIEIISSPNGDSSSTNSAYRISPKTSLSSSKGRNNYELFSYNMGNSCSGSGSGNNHNISGNNNNNNIKKGHCREPSEVSIKSDDSSQTENDKLMRRCCELQEMLEIKEYKLIELNKQNTEFYDKYNELLKQIDTKQIGTHNTELTNVTEEYTQRLSALEKKFQQSIRERDHLRKQLDQAKTEIQQRIHKEQVDKLLNDKEYIIIELRQEGEKLSKQILQHSNIIKKLRSKEKDNEQLIKKQKEQIDEQQDETERLKKTLSAKDDVERTQIEAVHKLSSEKRRLEKENGQLKMQLDDNLQKLQTVQISFDLAKKELSDKKQTHTELSRKTEALQTLENETKIVQNQKEQMLCQIEELREKIRQSEINYTQREQKLRQENGDLVRRLEEAEIRMESQAQDVTIATIPLIKQLESLQTSFNVRTAAWDKREKSLIDELNDEKKKLTTLNDYEQNSKEQVIHLTSRISNLEERLSTSLLKSEQATSLLQQKEMEYNLMEVDYKMELEKLTNQKRENEDTLEKNDTKLKILEEQLKREKEKYGAEKQKLISLQRDDNKSNESMDDSMETQSTKTVQTLQGGGGGSDQNKRESMGSSPTLSLGRISFSESQGSAAWNLDDFDYFTSGRQAGGGPESVYGSNSFVPIGHTSFLETLQSTLKQRDGEIHQLQWELSRLQIERNFLTTEISTLTLDLDQIKEKLETNETLEEQYKELQKQYDALLEMYGEKVEEFQELKLDLDDVKEMYKGQIDELLRQQKLTNQNIQSKSFS